MSRPSHRPEGSGEVRELLLPLLALLLAGLVSSVIESTPGLRILQAGRTIVQADPATVNSKAVKAPVELLRREFAEALRETVEEIRMNSGQFRDEMRETLRGPRGEVRQALPLPVVLRTSRKTSPPRRAAGRAGSYSPGRSPGEPGHLRFPAL